MNMYTITNCSFILAGAIIMLLGIVAASELNKTLPLVPKLHRKRISHHLMFHRALMMFFLCSYVAVLIAYAFDYHLLMSEMLVSVIFFFGAIFVLIGVNIQSKLLLEVQSTFQGILPICCKCKKIRDVDSEHKDHNAWKSIETYISEKTDVDFSHGYCPHCYEEELKKIQKKKNITRITDGVFPPGYPR